MGVGAGPVFEKHFPDHFPEGTNANNTKMWLQKLETYTKCTFMGGGGIGLCPPQRLRSSIPGFGKGPWRKLAEYCSPRSWGGVRGERRGARGVVRVPRFPRACSLPEHCAGLPGSRESGRQWGGEEASERRRARDSAEWVGWGGGRLGKCPSLPPPPPGEGKWRSRAAARTAAWARRWSRGRRPRGRRAEGTGRSSIQERVGQAGSAARLPSCSNFPVSWLRFPSNSSESGQQPPRRAIQEPEQQHRISSSAGRERQRAACTGGDGGGSSSSSNHNK